MKQILVVSPNGESRKFNSVADLSRKYKISQNTALNWLKGKSKPTGELKGCTVKYAEAEDMGVEYERDKNKTILSTENNIIFWLNLHFDTFMYNELTGSIQQAKTDLTSYVDTKTSQMTLSDSEFETIFTRTVRNSIFGEGVSQQDQKSINDVMNSLDNYKTDVSVYMNGMVRRELKGSSSTSSEPMIHHSIASIPVVG